jgi:D-3-phosphoglycerate dehydrogenase / 2-oxoglutarate reductase
MAQRQRILLTHTPEMRRNYYGERALAGLHALGDVVRHEGEQPIATRDVLVASRGCAVVIADRATHFDAERIAGLRDTVAILRVAVDVSNIDVAAASQAGILVTQASRSWVAAVSELAIGLMIDAARGISTANVAYKVGHVPIVKRGRQLAGATAGIIGFGPLGKRVAELCRALGMTIIVHDPYVTNADANITFGSLDDVCRNADFLLPLAVATPETENIIGARTLALMKPDAFLINLSRGNLVDEAALERALADRRIAGAALDVGRAPDQMPSTHLARRADVSATPHIGGLTTEGIEGQALETVAQAAAILAGNIPIGAVNAAAASRLASLKN